MGIKGLSKFIKTYIPDAISSKGLSDLANKTIAIDANYFMYKYTISSEDYINKFRKQYEHLIIHNIKAFYVFDGKPPKEKKQVIDKRKEVNRRKNIDVSLDKIRELKNYFTNNNISYIECESEADFICCKLCELNIIDGCISDDMDFLTLGCNYLYRDYYQNSDLIIEYDRTKILKQFSNEQFIDICIFLGCDYCERAHDFVNRSLVINIFELFKTYNNLENVWIYLRNNDMFLFVDDEKECSVQEKWSSVRKILRNNITINNDIIDIVSKIDIKKYKGYNSLFFTREKIGKTVFETKKTLNCLNKKVINVCDKRFSSHREKNEDNRILQSQCKKRFETINRFDILIKN